MTHQPSRPPATAETGRLSPTGRVLLAMAAGIQLSVGTPLLAGIPARGPEPVAAAPEAVAGRYVATTLTATTGGVTTDELAAGVALRLTLHPDGRTLGALQVPAAIGGADTLIDLSGSWTLVADTVRFGEGGDTIVRRTPFRVSRDRLEGEATFGGTTLRVTLSR